MVALRHCIHPVEYLYTSVMLSHRQGRAGQVKLGEIYVSAYISCDIPPRQTADAGG